MTITSFSTKVIYLILLCVYYNWIINALFYCSKTDTSCLHDVCNPGLLYASTVVMDENHSGFHTFCNFYKEIIYVSVHAFLETLVHFFTLTSLLTSFLCNRTRVDTKRTNDRMLSYVNLFLDVVSWDASRVSWTLLAILGAMEMNLSLYACDF